MISHYVMVALGGGIGAMARVALSKVLPVAVMGVPLPILCVNVLGCFLMGLLVEWMTRHGGVSDNMRYFLVSGLLGGFTTFSAFSLEFGFLFAKHAYVPAFLYVMASVGLSLLFFFLGVKLFASCIP